MNFGEAVALLKKGSKVSREGWNGKSAWLVLISEGTFKVSLEAGEMTGPLAPFIAMRPVSGSLVPWLASQTDMLADDWVQVQDAVGAAR